MLNPSILDDWEDCTVARQLYLAKAATITGDQGEGESPHCGHQEVHIRNRGEFSSSFEVEVCHQGEERHRLGSLRQRRHSKQKKYLKNKVHKVR